MIKKIFSFFFYWGPPLFLMAFIFYLSSRPSFAIADQYWLNFLFFKSLHFLEYAILFIAFFRAFLNTFSWGKKTILGVAFLASFFWAVSDEVHQLFVASRHGQGRDVFIDSLGMGSAYFWLIKSKKNTFLKRFGLLK